MVGLFPLLLASRGYICDSIAHKRSSLPNALEDLMEIVNICISYYIGLPVIYLCRERWKPFIRKVVHSWIVWVLFYDFSV
jgi:hypothetical protein